MENIRRMWRNSLSRATAARPLKWLTVSSGSEAAPTACQTIYGYGSEKTRADYLLLIRTLFEYQLHFITPRAGDYSG